MDFNSLIKLIYIYNNTMQNQTYFSNLQVVAILGDSFPWKVVAKKIDCKPFQMFTVFIENR